MATEQKKTAVASTETDRTAEKRAAFMRVANSRLPKAFHAIDLIGNLSDRNNYQYDAADCGVIEKKLNERVAGIMQKFKSALEGKTATTTNDEAIFK
jgi:hypothetical protein